MINEEYRKQIEEMVMVDQTLRSRAKPGPNLETENFMVYFADHAHNWRIHRLVARFGYPSEKAVGPETLKSFWLLVQHQDADIELQEECLKRCGFAKHETAFLTDRILMRRGKPQIYGTQFHRNAEGERVTYPIQDEESVDERRASMGLETLAEYVRGQDGIK